MHCYPIIQTNCWGCLRCISPHVFCWYSEKAEKRWFFKKLDTVSDLKDEDYTHIYTHTNVTVCPCWSLDIAKCDCAFSVDLISVMTALSSELRDKWKANKTRLKYKHELKIRTLNYSFILVAHFVVVCELHWLWKCFIVVSVCLLWD